MRNQSSVKPLEELIGDKVAIYDIRYNEALHTLKHGFVELLLRHYSSVHKKDMNELLKDLLYRERVGGLWRR